MAAESRPLPARRVVGGHVVDQDHFEDGNPSDEAQDDGDRGRPQHLLRRLVRGSAAPRPRRVRLRARQAGRAACDPPAGASAEAAARRAGTLGGLLGRAIILRALPDGNSVPGGAGSPDGCRRAAHGLPVILRAELRSAALGDLGTSALLLWPDRRLRLLESLGSPRRSRCRVPVRPTLYRGPPLQGQQRRPELLSYNHNPQDLERCAGSPHACRRYGLLWDQQAPPLGGHDEFGLFGRGGSVRGGGRGRRR
mmetsp:Transcript_41965/g.97145  ORF Transcript_41965/g.97145 Transcript_41965/m.97145 type:complete len:252 (-) Transcript_41965:359-1114(-)